MPDELRPLPLDRILEAIYALSEEDRLSLFESINRIERAGGDSDMKSVVIMPRYKAEIAGALAAVFVGSGMKQIKSLVEKVKRNKRGGATLKERTKRRNELIGQYISAGITDAHQIYAL
jgi:hypothetical protein